MVGKEAIVPHIRWMIRRDMPTVLWIEKCVFEFPWLVEDFVTCLRQTCCIGMVAERDDQVVGYMVYELGQANLRLLNFAVSPEYQRRGVGMAMVKRLVAKLSPQRRSRITLEVRESNLAAQLFFRAQGFRCENVVRGYYPDAGEDAYVMVYRYAAALADRGVNPRRAITP